MKKILFILYCILLSIAELSAQKDTAWIAPFYYVEVDTAKWKILFDAPDPIMMYRAPIPQQIVHKETGLVIFFQTGYAMEEAYLKWQLVQDKKRTTIGDQISVTDTEVQQSQYNLVFGSVRLRPEENFKKFAACSLGKTKQTMANGFILAQSPCYLLVHSPNPIGAFEQEQLKNFVKGVKTTTTKHLDQVRSRALAAAGNKEYQRQARWKEISAKIQWSEFSNSTSQQNELNERKMVTSFDSLFTFQYLDSQLCALASPKADPFPIFVQAGFSKAEGTDACINYHLKEHRRYHFCQNMAMFHLQQRFPKGIEKLRLVSQEDQGRSRIYEGYGPNAYYFLTLAMSDQTANLHLDSVRTYHLKTNGPIFPAQLGPGFDYLESVEWQKLTMGDGPYMIVSAHRVKQKDVVAPIFEDVHFYQPTAAKNKLTSLLPPKNLETYQALVKYTITEADQLVMNLHCAAKDTVRFYHNCELKDSAPRMIYYNGPNGEELRCPPAKRLYGTSLFTTDLNQNGHREFWRFFVCNGIVVQTNFYATSALDASLNTAANQTSILSCPQLQTLLRMSKSTAINNHFLVNRSYTIEPLIVMEEELYSEAELMYEDHLYIERLKQDTTVYQRPTKKAYFKDEDYAAQRYIEDQLKYKRFGQLPPPSTRYAVNFIVEKDGSLSFVHARCLSQTIVPHLEEKLLQVISEMPKWNPATVSGVPVRSFGAVYFGIYVK